MSNSPENPAPSNEDFDLSIGVGQAGESDDVVTARRAGALADMELSISPRTQDPEQALGHLAKAFNVALKLDFIETDLDRMYKVAQVRDGKVELIHKDYIGLGDGLFATIGKATRSFRLTFEGPDAASPEGEQWIAEHGGSSVAGVLSLIGRKLNLLQEYEDMVPMYVEQTLDRLEAKKMITDWNRGEWKVTTSVIGLDVIIEPVLKDESEEA